MGKRPRIKGLGADIYLGGRDEQPRSESVRPAESASTTPVAQEESNQVESYQVPPAEIVLQGPPRILESAAAPSCAQTAASYVLNWSEKVANYILDLQHGTLMWTIEAFFTPCFVAQDALARQWVDCSFNTARRLWLIRTAADQ
jgi:hypothetical protein